MGVPSTHQKSFTFRRGAIDFAPEFPAPKPGGFFGRKRAPRGPWERGGPWSPAIRRLRGEGRLASRGVRADHHAARQKPLGTRERSGGPAVFFRDLWVDRFWGVDGKRGSQKEANGLEGPRFWKTPLWLPRKERRIEPFGGGGSICLTHFRTGAAEAKCESRWA